MVNFLFMLLYFVIMLAIMFGIMYLGRKYVFSKVRINKFIPLGIAIVLFALQIFVPMFAPKLSGKGITFILTILTVTFFVWFLDIVTTGGPKQKEKKIVIRPKAKPNRLKHLNNVQDKK